jgi:predicted Zn-dependent protease with MMP-like domain
MRLKPGWTLFGLYEGVPQTKRGNPYALILPDKITIFRLPIEHSTAADPAAIKEIVKNTVWHEVAHHFGMDEQQVRTAERKKRI